MRQHYYGRVRNTYGTVQAGVDVSIYLAGTVNAAIVYTVASGGTSITVAPQVQSDSDGLIDFYLDESYGVDQLFDLKTGDKTYENISMLLGDGDMTKSIYDTNDDSIVDKAESVLLAAEAELTIATGIITVTQVRHKVDTEANAASDDLVTINGGATVNMIVLRAEADARTVVVKHGTGNIWLQGKSDISLDDLEDGILLFWDSTNSKWFDTGGGGGGGGDTLPVVDTTGIAKGSVDASKIVRFDVDGLTTGTTRVLAVPDKDITLVGTVDIPSDPVAGTAGLRTLGSGAQQAGAGDAVALNTAKITNATHTGEVTGATALTIAANAVTNAKAAQMATKTYKGRTTAATGNAEDVPVATVKADLALVKGDVGLGNVENTVHSTDAHTMTIDGRDVSVDGAKLDTLNANRYIQIRLLDKDTSHTVAAAIGGEFRLKVAMTVLAVGCYFDTAGTISVTTIDINEGGTSILSTKTTVDATEKTSETAATPSVISDSAIAADGIITFDIDGIASGTAGKGLVIWLEVTIP